MYKPEDVESLNREVASINRKHAAIVETLARRSYRNALASEYALHGLSRRLYTLKECIEVLFEALPPDSMDIPTDRDRRLAMIAVQAFVINLFGCIDNLARVWVEERQVQGRDGQPLKDKRIGMGGKYREIRESFSEGFRQYLDSRSDWLGFMVKFRDALAHRISPYIPPYSIRPKDKAAYDEFGAAALVALCAHKFDEYEKLIKQQEALRFFRPWMTHSLGEGAPLVALHPQMLADFNTIEEMTKHLLSELDLVVVVAPG